MLSASLCRCNTGPRAIQFFPSLIKYLPQCQWLRRDVSFIYSAFCNISAGECSCSYFWLKEDILWMSKMWRRVLCFEPPPTPKHSMHFAAWLSLPSCTITWMVEPEGLSFSVASHCMKVLCRLHLYCHEDDSFATLNSCCGAGSSTEAFPSVGSMLIWLRKSTNCTRFREPGKLQELPHRSLML